MSLSKFAFLATAMLLNIVTASAQCAVSFTLPAVSCSGQATIITNTSPSSIDSSLWYWSGANTGNAYYQGKHNDTSVFNNPGLTHICLIIDSVTCKDTVCHDITITSTPTSPSFTYTSGVCSGSPVSLSVTSPVGGATYSWSLGGSGTTRNYTFNSIGAGAASFPVTLTVTKGGCSTSSTQTVIINQQPLVTLVDVFNTQQFTNCGGGSLIIQVVDSIPQSTNSNYSINWGDGSAIYTTANLSDISPVTHTYSSLGYFTVTETVTSNAGCIASRTFSAFNGSNPSGSLGNPGGTTGLCAPFALSFPINGVATNTPGTQYIISVNDGSASDTFSQPPPSSFAHTFNISSCGFATPSYSNSFDVKMQVINQCNSSTIIVDPITMSTVPAARFNVSPDTIVCVNSNVTFTNASTGGNYVNNSNNCDSTSILNWIITPLTGYSIVSGQIGSNPPIVAIAGTWGSGSLTANFTTPGTYSIKLKIRNKSNCGSDSIIKNICVISPPVSQFTVGSTLGCGPVTITPNNTSTIPSGCSATATTTNWVISKNSTPCPGDSTVDYRFISGTSAQSTTPTIRFNNSGTYSLNLNLINACGTFPATAQTITVKAKPTASIPASTAICSGQSASFNATTQPCGGTISSYNWSFANGTPATSAISNPTIGFANAGTDNISLSVTNECGTSVANSTISVLNAPAANAGPDVQFCTGQSAQIGSASVVGLTYSWSPTTGLSNSAISNPTLSLTNITGSPVTYLYVVTVKNSANCTSKDTVIVTVNPQPTVSVNSPNTCSGVSVGLTASGTSDTYTWSPAGGLSTTTGATVSVTNPTTNVSYTVTGVVTATGCTNTATATVSVTQSPTVTQPTNIMVCNGSPTAAISFAGTGTSYNWANSNPSIGLAASGTGTIGSFTGVNAGTTPLVATVTVTPQFAGSGLTCTGPSKTFSITVNPSPSVNQPSSQVVCNGSPTSAISFTGTGTNYNWTNNTSSIGLAASGTGNIASFTAANATSSPVVATITVTPVALTCQGSPQSFSITVDPAPTAQFSIADQTICSNTLSAPVTISSTSSPVTITWSCTPPAGITGLTTTSGTTSIPAMTLTNTTAAPIIITFSASATTTGGTSCPGGQNLYHITVNPTPSVTQPTNITVCNGSLTPAINFTGTGTSYNWANNTTSIGLAASGTGNIASFTAINNGSTPVVATITVTPQYTAGGVTCPGPSLTFTISVNPSPTVSQPVNEVICNNSPTTTVSFTGTGTSYNWTNNTTSIGLTASGTGDIASFTAVNVTSSPVTATITVTPTALTCPGPSKTFTITVNPTPTVTQPANATVCNGSPATAISFAGTGTSYIWSNSTPSIGLAASGTGTIGLFTAVNTGTAPVVATVTVSPLYTNGGVTCSGTSQSFSITVNPSPSATQPSNQVVCN